MIDLLRLFRLYYAIPMSSILVLTIWYAAGDEIALQLRPTLTATLALALVIAGGYALNDVCDWRTDQINAPNRPIAAGRVRRPVAAVWAGVLLLGGLMLSALCRWQFFVVLSAVTVVLVFYDCTSKRLGIGKQLIVAMLMTSYYPLAFAQVAEASSSRVQALYLFPIWLFLTSFGYEVLKDVRDIHGDQTIAAQPTWVQRRPQLALGIARTTVIVGSLALIGPAFLGCGWVYAAIVPVAILLALWSTLLPCKRAMVAIYGECVVVGIAALADIIVLGS